MDEIIDLARQYDNIYSEHPSKWESAARNSFALRALEHYPRKRLLDIGCGSGHTLEFFKAFWPEVEYWGIDISKVALSLAAARVPSAVFVCGLEAVPPEKAFDIVLLMGVVEHFKDPGKTLGEIANLLTPDGVLYIAAPKNMQEGDEEGWRASALQMEWHYTRETWERIIRGAGYIILKYQDAPGEFVWILK